MVRLSVRASSKNCNGVLFSRKMGQQPGRSPPCNAACVRLPMGCQRSALSPFCIPSMKQATLGRRIGRGVRPVLPSTRQRMVLKSDTIPIRKAQKTVIERAYVTAERLGLQLWCQDEGGPYQSIPQPCSSFQPQGRPARRPHEYVRGGTAKLLTLFRPATGDVRAEAVEQSTNAILHPWLKRELEAMLVATGPTLDATAWEAQEQQRRMRFLDAFVRFATTAE